MQLYKLASWHNGFKSALKDEHYFRKIEGKIQQFGEYNDGVVVVSRDTGKIHHMKYNLGTFAYIFIAKDQRTLLGALEMIAGDPVSSEGKCQIAAYAGRYRYDRVTFGQYLGPLGHVMDFGIATSNAVKADKTLGIVGAAHEVMKKKQMLERTVKDIRFRGSWFAIGPKVDEVKIGKMVGVIGASTTIGGAVRLLDPYFGEHEDTGDAGMF